MLNSCKVPQTGDHEGAEKHQVGLFLTITVETMEKEQSLHLTDEILASILNNDVLSMDESAIAEVLHKQSMIITLFVAF